MKRRLFSLVFLIVFVASTIPCAFAETTPTVTYNGSSISYNYTDTNNFGSSFTGMVPGESRTLEIDLVNSYSKKADFFMDTKVIKAFEDAISASGAAYHVSLDVENGGTTTNIYGGSNGTTVGGDKNGLYDLNGSLNDTYMVAALDAGKSAALKLTVKLDGESSTNQYQALNGTFQFQFSAVNDSDYTGTVTPSTSPSTQNVVKTVVTGVKTGDPASIAVLIAVMVICIGVVILLVVTGKKKKTGGSI